MSIPLPPELEPNTEVARRYIAANQPQGRVLLCSVTGAHHYGFPSPDSDLDLKGIHIAPTRGLLGLGGVTETLDRTEVFDGVECDLTINEVGRALDLLVRGNGNMLERIRSPYQLVDTPEVAELQRLATSLVSRRFYGHYRGFGQGVRREYQRGTKAGVKGLLYVYRVALTGVHLLLTGETVADLTVTAPLYGFDEALELVERKRVGAEKAPIPRRQAAPHVANWERLDEVIADARDRSPLPDAAPSAAIAAASDWLVGLRLAEV